MFSDNDTSNALKFQISMPSCRTNLVENLNFQGVYVDILRAYIIGKFAVL